MINYLTNAQKGSLYIIGGFILLFHTVGLIERGLNIVIILGSIALIVYGFMLGDFHKKIMNIIKKKPQI